MNIKNIFPKLLNEPCIIGVIANANEGKSNLLYNIIEESKNKTNVFVFGLKYSIERTINFSSLEELEEIKNSLIIIDEFKTLFNIENRQNKEQIEELLRFIYHNNNIILLCGLPENFKKFISAKLNKIVFKKCFYNDFINGSGVKKILNNYKNQYIKGTTQLNLNKDECLIYNLDNNKRYIKTNIDYLKKFDSKKDNVKVINWKNKTKEEIK